MFFNSRIKYFNLHSMCTEIENELKFITIGLLLSFMLISLSSDSIILQTIAKVITVLSLCLSAILLKYIVNLSPKHNIWEHNSDVTLVSYNQSVLNQKKMTKRNEAYDLIVKNIPNYSNIQQKLRYELERVGKMSNLSEILDLKFFPDDGSKTTRAILSYKKLQDNRKAKMLFNGFVFCGKSLEIQVGNEVEVDTEASLKETKNIATQTWIMS